MRVPPPRKSATGMGYRAENAPPPMPPPSKGAHNVERRVSSALQPLDHNAPSAPGRLSLLPKHDKPQPELILVTPKGRSASQNDNKQQGVAVIPFRPIDGVGGEAGGAGGVENIEPERGDEQPKRDNAGRILRPTGQTLRCEPLFPLITLVWNLLASRPSFSLIRVISCSILQPHWEHERLQELCYGQDPEDIGGRGGLHPKGYAACRGRGRQGSNDRRGLHHMS